MNNSKKPKRETENGNKPTPKPPGADPKDKPVRDVREDPAPNPGGNPADQRPKKRP